MNKMEMQVVPQPLVLWLHLVVEVAEILVRGPQLLIQVGLVVVECATSLSAVLLEMANWDKVTQEEATQILLLPNFMVVVEVAAVRWLLEVMPRPAVLVVRVEMVFHFPLVAHQFYMQLVAAELESRLMEMAVVVILTVTMPTMVGQVSGQLRLLQIEVMEVVGSGLTNQPVILKLVHQVLWLSDMPQQGVRHLQ